MGGTIFSTDIHWSKKYLSDFILLILTMVIWMNNYQNLINVFSLTHGFSFFFNPIFPCPGSKSAVMLFYYTLINNKNYFGLKLMT